MRTFADLGIPFPLFTAPLREAAEYHGVATCTVCGMEGVHCFTLGIGAYLVLSCPQCGTGNALDVEDQENEVCRQCSAAILFPPRLCHTPEEPSSLACYACLRRGAVARTKDTEVGMVGWHEALAGLTDGAPGLDDPDFELMPQDAEEADRLYDPPALMAGPGPVKTSFVLGPRYVGWVRAQVPQRYLLELLHTPGYSTWQGESWRFHCDQPMIYLGTWDPDEFQRQAPDGDGRALFDRLLPGEDALWDGRMHDVTAVYVFRCPQCSQLAAHWDMA